MSSALEKICPTPTSGKGACTTDVVDIPRIHYPLEQDLYTNGELEVKVESSNYDSSEHRETMIKMAATTIANSTADKNCWNAQYDGVPQNNRLLKRQTYPQQETGSERLCNGASFAGVQYYDGKSPGATAWIDADFRFKTQASTEGIFDCEFITGLVLGALSFAAPELAPEDAALESIISVTCELTMNH